MKKLQKAQKTLIRSNPAYSEFLRKRQEQDEEEQFRKQGALLAGVLQDKFGPNLSSASVMPPMGPGPQSGSLPAQQTGSVPAGAVATHGFVFPTDASRFGGTSTSASSGGPPPGMHGAQAFSPEQLEQIKALLTTLAPAHQQPPDVSLTQIEQLKKDLGIESKPGPSRRIVQKGGKQAASAVVEDSLTPLQAAVINSLFAGKVDMKTSSTVKDLEDALLPLWSQRCVPSGLSDFITHNAPAGTKVAKGKSDRVAQFWDTLVGMH